MPASVLLAAYGRVYFLSGLWSASHNSMDSPKVVRGGQQWTDGRAVSGKWLTAVAGVIGPVHSVLHRELGVTGRRDHYEIETRQYT